MKTPTSPLPAFSSNAGSSTALDKEPRTGNADTIDAPSPWPERRRGRSDLERGSALLSHAVEYLVSEQLAGRRHPIQPNREAIAILCEAGRQIQAEERRKLAKASIASWLRGAALFRATQD
jgi:hypothetical protein